jgi:hypothetical protein
VLPLSGANYVRSLLYFLYASGFPILAHGNHAAVLGTAAIAEPRIDASRALSSVG